MNKPSIAVIGLGYVGLTTAVTFASKGFPVYGLDIDSGTITRINSSNPTFYEPMLEELLKEALRNGFKAGETLELSDIYFITVGTPSGREGNIDLSYVKAVAEKLGGFLKDVDGYHLVVVKSTVVPGTTEGVVKPIIESASGKMFGDNLGLAMNPEFLKEGSAVQNSFEPDRVVIGEYDRKSGDVLLDLYRQFYGGNLPPVLRTTIANSEFIKYASNAFLATKISFINMIASIAQRVPSADVKVIAEGIGLDRRIGPKFLNAGLGYGGSCFPKDVRALIAFSKSVGYDPILLDDVDEINVRQPEVSIELARRYLGSSKDSKIAVLGLSFKPETDDIRDAVSVRIINRLLAEGAKVSVYDPVATENVSKLFGNRIAYASSALEAIKDADCCIIVTEWDEFKKLEPSDFIERMRKPVLIDGRRIYDPEKYACRMKFAAVGLGTVSKISVGSNIWRNPAIAVNAIIEEHGKILLIRRNQEPFMGMFSLPGGYVEYGETVKEAVGREIKEETGLDMIESRLIDVYSDPLRHPEKHVISLLYEVSCNGALKVNGDEVSEGDFYDAKNLPGRLAFDHSKMIEGYIRWKGGRP